MTEWTQDQLRAIEGKANILVNAAAGSGKTAVLTERITRKLIPDEKGGCKGTLEEKSKKSRGRPVNNLFLFIPGYGKKGRYEV